MRFFANMFGSPNHFGEKPLGILSFPQQTPPPSRNNSTPVAFEPSSLYKNSSKRTFNENTASASNSAVFERESEENNAASPHSDNNGRTATENEQNSDHNNEIEAAATTRNSKGYSCNTKDGTDDSEPQLDFPDGGLRAWLCVLGSFFGLVNCFGITNSTSAVETYISHHQLKESSASSVGWVFSIYIAVGLLFSVFTGHVFDTRGPRIPIIMGTILSFSGVFAMANCTEIWQFILALGIVAGLGTAVQIPALVGVISHYFYKRRGIAIGLSTVGGSVGGAVFPIMLRKLYTAVGFVWAIRIFAFVLGTLDLCALVLITPRFPPRKMLSEKEMTYWQMVTNFFSKTIDLQAFKDPKFTCCTLGVTFSEVFLMTAMTYYGSYSVFMGNSQDTTYLLITILNTTGIFARAAAGFISDFVGKYNLMTGMIFFSSVFCLVIWLPFGNQTSGLYVFSVLYGIASTAVLSLTPLCVSQISRVNEFGRRYSTCYFVVAIGTLVGIPISGIFIGDRSSAQQYNNFIVFVSVLGFVGVFFWMLSRYFAVKFKLCVY